jgi:hypothetical protein
MLYSRGSLHHLTRFVLLYSRLVVLLVGFGDWSMLSIDSRTTGTDRAHCRGLLWLSQRGQELNDQQTHGRQEGECVLLGLRVLLIVSPSYSLLLLVSL